MLLLACICIFSQQHICLLYTSHSALLTGAARYKAVIGERDYKTACRAIKAAGYATDPQYADKLIQIIESYGLTAYDGAGSATQPAGRPETSGGKNDTAGGKTPADAKGGGKMKASEFIKNCLLYTSSHVDNVIYEEGGQQKALSAKLAEIIAAVALKADSTAVTADIKAANDALYNKIMGITAEDGATVNEAYDTLKEVAALSLIHI